MPRASPPPSPSRTCGRGWSSIAAFSSGATRSCSAGPRTTEAPQLGQVLENMGPDLSLDPPASTTELNDQPGAVGNAACQDAQHRALKPEQQLRLLGRHPAPGGAGDPVGPALGPGPRPGGSRLPQDERDLADHGAWAGRPQPDPASLGP